MSGTTTFHLFTDVDQRRDCFIHRGGRSGLRLATTESSARHPRFTGILGAFTGAGIVVGTAKFYALSLGGGDATFGVLFAAIFIGFGFGIVGGPRAVGSLSRWRCFASSIVLAGVRDLVIDVPIARAMLLVAGVCGVLVGVAALRQMEDRPGRTGLRDV